MTSFPQLRAQARSLESRSESLLSELSAFTTSAGSSQSDDERSLIERIEQAFSEREDITNGLQRLLDSEPTAGATKTHQVVRHLEALADHRREFKRIQGLIEQERNSRNLLSSVRSEIENHRQRSVTPGQQEEEYMLAERNRIDNSHSLADSLLAQAYETRDEFLRQRASLVNVQRRISQAASHIPGLNTIIAKVNTRKRRDSLIIAGLITLCVLIIFFFH